MDLAICGAHRAIGADDDRGVPQSFALRPDFPRWALDDRSGVHDRAYLTGNLAQGRSRLTVDLLLAPGPLAVVEGSGAPQLGQHDQIVTALRLHRGDHAG